MKSSQLSIDPTIATKNPHLKESQLRQFVLPERIAGDKSSWIDAQDREILKSHYKLYPQKIISSAVMCFFFFSKVTFENFRQRRFVRRERASGAK